MFSSIYTGQKKTSNRQCAIVVNKHFTPLYIHQSNFELASLCEKFTETENSTRA